MSQTRGDEKSGWWKTTNVPAPSVEAVQLMLSSWLDGRRVREVQLLPGGLMNRNCRVRIDPAPCGLGEPGEPGEPRETQSVVLRLYDRVGEACAREVAVLERLRRTVPVPEVLYAEPGARDGGPPFAVLQFVDGLSLRELKKTGDTPGEKTSDLVAIGEAAYDAGRLLARLQSHRFPSPGLLTPALTVDASFLPDPITTTRLIELFAKSPAFRRRVDSALLDRLLRVGREWDEGPAAPDVPTTLVHGDFNSRNLLVSQQNGKWRVAAILDWEFAFAGPVYCDIGNFLRYERAARPRFEPFFSRGCRDGGLDLRGEWLMAARIADLPALCELLAHESTPDDVAGEVLGLVTATLDQYK
ncbi:MAG TPA: phosphotransferase [Vicinamibacterales bacterium]|jgi:aminoglycoside phosphotransferase (APT) family kinase protein|nr:phosphotransferase [Vicinamibacterales bacterium]